MFLNASGEGLRFAQCRSGLVWCMLFDKLLRSFQLQESLSIDRQHVWYHEQRMHHSTLYSYGSIYKSGLQEAHAGGRFTSAAFILL